MAEKITIVISEGRGNDSTYRALQQDVAARLAGRPNVQLVVVPHLYDLEPEGPAMQRLRSIAGDMIVLGWLYPRAAYWVLDANRVKGRMGETPTSAAEQPTGSSAHPEEERDDRPQRRIWCLDLRSYKDRGSCLEQIAEIVEQATGQVADAGSAAEPAALGAEIRVDQETHYRWYPVIDYDRCQNCLECLNFCLFGVFEIDQSQQVIVEQPDACRDGCPACSRVCPSRAIMFPHHHSPAIAGDPEAAADGFNLDLVQLAGLAGLAGPGDLARAERDRAVSEAAGSAGPKTDEPSEQSDLDGLVDEIDKMDL